ncbi:MAG TPA: response regulator transcription factor [Bacteroidota bacterium]|nr:response regulator transcription factor [Bacteroidota bacterium]
MKKIRIFLIEDNRILLDGLSKLVSRQTDMTLVGTAGSGDEISVNVRKARPHIVLIDTVVVDEGGAQIARRLKSEVPELKIIGMGLSASQPEIADFIKAGATGFILKDAGTTEVTETIRWVARETKVILPYVPEALFPTSEAHTDRTAPLPPEDDTSIQLTKREREIVRLIADSSSNKEIARRLNIATFTVKSHVHNILVRLGLHSRLQIAKFALMSLSVRESAVMSPREQDQPPVALASVKQRTFGDKYREIVRGRQKKFALSS